MRGEPRKGATRHSNQQISELFESSEILSSLSKRLFRQTDGRLDGRPFFVKIRIKPPHFAQTDTGVMRMRYVRSRRKDKTPVLRLEPEKRLCPLFDPVTIAEFPVAEPGEMGFRVLDNFCEEHIE